MLYDGDDRFKQVQALGQLTEDIFCELPVEVGADDISLDNLSDYLPNEWPQWFVPKDLALLVRMVKEKLQ